MPGAEPRPNKARYTDSPPSLVLMVGPDKAGSSWLHELARWHPAVSVPPAKDVFFWNVYHDRGLSWYFRQFRSKGVEEVRFEACHDYLYSDEVPARLADSGLDVHVIVVLRNPLDRALSAYLYMVRQGRLRATGFSSALRSVPELLDHGRYGRYSQRFVQELGRDRVHFLDFEIMRHTPSRAAEWFFRRLGVELPESIPDPLLQPVRAASRARLQPLATAGKRVAVVLRHHGLHSIVGMLKRNALVESVLFRPVGAADRPRPSTADAAYTRECLEADVRRLDEIVGGAFSWKWLDG